MNEDEMGLIEVSASKSGGCWGRHLKDWGLACSTMCCESKGWWVRRCLRIPRKSTAAPSPDQSLCCRGWRDHGSYVDPYRSQGCWPVFFFFRNDPLDVRFWTTWFFEIFITTGTGKTPGTDGVLFSVGQGGSPLRRKRPEENTFVFPRSIDLQQD